MVIPTHLGPTFETPRLILRPPVATDLAQWSLVQNDNEVVVNPGTGEAQPAYWADLLKVAGAWALHGFGSFCVVEKGTHALVGRVGPTLPLGWPCVEVGWAIRPEFEGRGLAFEAATAAMDYVFNDLKLERVIHTIRPSNLPSQKLAAKLGSTNKGPIALPPPYEGIPNDEWGQTREEWLSRPSF